MIFRSLFLILFIFNFNYCYAYEMILNDTPVNICFSPKGGCEQNILYMLDKTKSNLLIQAYQLTNKNIINKLIDLHKQGIQIIIILDKSMLRYNDDEKDYNDYVKMLSDNNITIYIDNKPAIAHSKVMIIDDKYLITGSYNFTFNAENRNVENMLIFDSLQLCKIYKVDFNERLSLSYLYKVQ